MNALVTAHIILALFPFLVLSIVVSHIILELLKHIWSWCYFCHQSFCVQNIKSIEDLCIFGAHCLLNQFCNFLFGFANKTLAYIQHVNQTYKVTVQNIEPHQGPVHTLHLLLSHT